MRIRTYVPDDLGAVQMLYIDAFAGFPWFENLTHEEIEQRMASDLSKDTFTCLVGEVDEEIVATSWGICLDLDELALERGQDLCDAIAEHAYQRRLFWERELIVHPKVQGQGLGGKIRTRFLDHVAELFAPALLLTRMRDDNVGTLKIAMRLGFEPTGITRPAIEKPGAIHQFYMKKIEA